jgi:ATP-dependent exoDNAse (exonuclease V) alpha subunit
MRGSGRLGDEEVTAHDRAFATGDRVILLRNNTSLDVDNGDRGVVIAVDPGRRALTVELDAGSQVGLPDWYLDAGWVDHGYALTAHKLQSTTVDRTFASRRRFGRAAAAHARQTRLWLGWACFLPVGVVG